MIKTDNQHEISSYLDSLSLLLLGVLLFALPLVLSPLTTDPFALPKEFLLSAIALTCFLLLGTRMISEGSVRIRRTPFDLPILLFALFTLISSLLAVNRFDALSSLVPLLFGILVYFLIVNVSTRPSTTLFLTGSLIAGAALSAVLTFLAYLKIYVLPQTLFGTTAAFTHTQNFNTFGSLLDQGIYLAAILPLSGLAALTFAQSLWPKVFGKSQNEHVFLASDKENPVKTTLYIVGFFMLAAGIITAIFEMTTTQKPILLPFETGFQTAFAAISQDTNRTLIGFLLGSGFGTYMADFTRFKQSLFNLSPDLWSFTFLHSSSFILELLATTGLLGIFSYLFIFIKFIKVGGWSKTSFINPLFLSTMTLFLISFVLPLSFTTQTLLFILLAVFAAGTSLQNDKKGNFFDLEFYFVALKKGFISVSSSPFVSSDPETRKRSKILPVSFFIIILLVSGALGFVTWLYASSDVLFQHSLVAASQNNGLQTYNDETSAIKIFPYRDAYHRIYSQTNLALANSLAASQPKGVAPNEQVQQTIYTLIQQSINSARNATVLSPQTALNWQNLSSIYRALIGFGQNAENFSILANNQAILMDPNNPSQYINLGGIYYQLKQWDDAQRQFQIAINLKPDLANAYYNLGHTLENKGDLQNALKQYQTVQSLIGNNETDAKIIKNDIEALNNKLGNQQSAAQPAPTESQPTKQPSLNIETPPAQLPTKTPPVKIPSP